MTSAMGKPQPRMFGDSVQSSPVNTLSRNSGGSLSSLYQTRKANDSATVFQIKEQFQKQIEEMLKSSERHETPPVRLPMLASSPPARLPSLASSQLSSNKFRPGNHSSSHNSASSNNSKLTQSSSAVRSHSTVVGKSTPQPNGGSSHARLPSLQLDPPPEFCGGTANSRHSTSTSTSGGGTSRDGDTPRRWGLADISSTFNGGGSDLSSSSSGLSSRLKGHEGSSTSTGSDVTSGVTSARSRLDKNGLLSRQQENRHASPRSGPVSSPTRVEDRLRDLRPTANPPPPPQPRFASPSTRPDVSISPRKPESPPNFMNIQRGKSFFEARSAVQRQIEKMFTEANTDELDHRQRPTTSSNVKHTMHGVSHVRPDEEDMYLTPPPTHYGVTEAIKAISSSSNNNNNNHNRPIIESDRDNPFNSDSDKSKTERFTSRSIVAEMTIDRKEKFSSSADSMSSRSGFNSSIDLGNIIMQPRKADESLAALVRRRERSREQDENVRRISVHQERFEFNDSPTSTTPPSVSAAQSLSGQTDSSVSPSRFGQDLTRAANKNKTSSPNESLGTRVEVRTKHKSSVNIHKSKPVKYKVEYLGAVPIRSKATNLEYLQVPLKELYFKHKALQSLGHSNLPGTLEISDTGLKVQYIRELHKGVQELFNSFPTIAVWAAVKFAYRPIVTKTSERRHRFSFVPLIRDSTGAGSGDEDQTAADKNRIYHDLDYEEICLAAAGPHPPVFACVMRRAGNPKQLECHGFICNSAEDAIIIAANLYQALVDTMKKNKHSGKVDPHSPRSMRRNEFERKSTRKSRRGEPPIRPPRKKRNRGDEPRVVTGLVRRRSIRSSTRSVKSNRSNKSNKSGRRRIDPVAARRGQISRDDLGRKSSRRPGNGDLPRKPQSEVKGDILTKVQIGRTKSFAKTNNQYNLQELFRELKEKEGVDSIDDVLQRVISPNGMSFNNIKPVYRELLLKLAMTMSQDEIFERSKTIMASNKKVFKKASEQNNQGSLGSFFKSFSRQNSKANSAASTSKRSTSTMDMSSSKSSSGLSDRTAISGKTSKTSRSGKGLTKADISGPMPIMGGLTDLPPLPPTAKSMDMLKNELQNDQITDDAYVSCSECAYESVCAYGSCACRDKKPARLPLGELKEVAQECDADSCISSEKCYCSLPRDSKAGSKHSTHGGTNTSVYSEITAADSGTVTDTSCYSYSMSGTIRSNHHSTLPGGQIKSHSLSPVGTWRGGKDTASTCCSCSEYSGPTDINSIRSTRGLPPLPTDIAPKNRQNGGSAFKGDSQLDRWRGRNTSPRRNVSDGRGSEGSSCGSARSSVSPTNMSVRSATSPTGSNSSQQKVLVLSAVDTRGNIVYRGSSHHNTKVHRAALPDEQHILSMKKTAEIAAMFTGSPIGQKSDLLDSSSSPNTTTTSGVESDSCSCSQSSSSRLGHAHAHASGGGHHHRGSAVQAGGR